MNINNDKLWQRLSQYQFDRIDARLPFSVRLTRENNWSHDFAVKVIEEYKKFVYLCVTVGHPVTPSEEVDQVWHLHLIYSDEYWNHFCRDVIQYAMHHHPTRGGENEGIKFYDWYSCTLASYAKCFNAQAPTDVWPAPVQRFANAAAFRRVNTQEYVLLKRATLKNILAVITAALVMAIAGTAAARVENDATDSGMRYLFLLLMFAILIYFAYSSYRKKRRRKRKDDGCSGAGGAGCGGCSTGSSRSTHNESSVDSGSDAGSGCGGGGCGGGCGGG